MENLDFVTIIINLVFTATMYMLGPLEIMYTQKADFTKKEARKIAIINSIVVYLLFIFLFIFVKDDGSAPMGTSAFFYGWINYLLLSRQTQKENKKEENK